MLSMVWGSSEENDSAQNLARRPSSMGGYLLKLKRRCTDDVRGAVLTPSPAGASAAGAGVVLADQSAALLDPFGQCFLGVALSGRKGLLGLLGSLEW